MIYLHVLYDFEHRTAWHGAVGIKPEHKTHRATS